jgi:hypothetical protein
MEEANLHCVHYILNSQMGSSLGVSIVPVSLRAVDTASLLPGQGMSFVVSSQGWLFLLLWLVAQTCLAEL